MTGATSLAAAAAVGPGGFALLVWASIALVVVAVGYVAYALLADRRPS
jgi:hypothetical protein